MPRPSPPRSRIERLGRRRASALRRRVADDVRHAREDAGLSQRAVARAAGVSNSTVAALERGSHDPTTEVLARVGAALGMDLSVRLFPGTGPLIRDHIQAAMIEALLGILHHRWRPRPEVWVTQPVRGVIDLVLVSDPTIEPVIATEAQSELRRLEQQIRWAQAKSAALAAAREQRTSRLLLVRNSRSTRAVVAEHAATVAAAYPARAAEAMAALAGTDRWTGATLLWVDIEGGRARLRPSPPRGITAGR